MREQMTISLWVEILDPIIQLLAIVFGFLIVSFQIRKGHRNTLKAQSQNQGIALKVAIHKEFLAPITLATSKVASAGQFPVSATIDMQRYREWADRGVRRAFPTHTIQAFNKLHMDALDALLQLISLLQNYEIIDPRLRLIRIAIGSANYDLSKAYRAYLAPGLLTLPNGFENEQNGFQPPSAQTIENLEQLGCAYSDVANVLLGYLHDMSVELQKALLGDLFEHSKDIAIREPFDNSVKVLVLDDSERFAELTKYFEEECPAATDRRESR